MDTSAGSIDFEMLADIINDGKCILFLGPEATVNYGDEQRLNSFFTQLREDNEDSIYSYNKEDGLFVFNNPAAIYGIQTKVRKFLNKDYYSPMLTKLAQIPFHCIISLTPDTALQNEMKKQGFAFNQDYYDTKNEHTPPPDLPTINTPPLIYHLLGIVSDTDTLIVSHGHVYEYIRSFLGGTRLPQNIKTAINFDNAKNLIFLGVNFDKWYFQLILNTLGVDASSYTCFASIQSGASSLQTIWEKHFHINFVPNQIDEFVDKLYKVFNQNNQLRTASTAPPKSRQYRITNFINYFRLAFNSTDLDSFCLSYYEDVHNDFTDGQGKTERINRLIEYVQQHAGYEQLLGFMKDENPAQYNNNVPYYDEQ